MNVYVTERVGVNYIYYVCTYTGLCTICSFFLKQGAIDRGAMGTGAIGQGVDVRGACVHGGICPGAIVLGGGGGSFVPGAIGRIPSKSSVGSVVVK